MKTSCVLTPRSNKHTNQTCYLKGEPKGTIWRAKRIKATIKNKINTYKVYMQESLIVNKNIITKGSHSRGTIWP